MQKSTSKTYKNIKHSNTQNHLELNLLSALLIFINDFL